MIISKKKCIDNCTNDDKYKYEYNKKCYDECPNGTIHNESDYTCHDIKNIEKSFIYNFINISIYIKDERDEEIEIYRGKISEFNVSENKEDIVSKIDNIQ